jgi:hypothetical protein
MIISITTAEELSNIRNNLAGDYVLENDIDLSSIANWQPIGTLANPFTGILDGNGKTISNLTINRPTEDNVGLFGFVNTAKSKHAPGNNSVLANPIIKNLWFADASVTGRDNVGVLVGQYTTDVGQGNDHMVVSSSYGFLCKDILLVGTVNGRNNVGGLVGNATGPLYAGHGPNAPQANALSYSVCDSIIGFSSILSYVTATGTGDNIGGIAGSLSAVRLHQCSAKQDISGANNVGGLAGHVLRTPFEYCYSTGNVTGAGCIAGGICGYAQDRGDFEYCYSTGNIKATGTLAYNPAAPYGETAYSRPDTGVGGLVGVWTQVDIVRLCCSFGTIEGERAGGLIGTGCGGTSASNISESFSRGTVKGYTCAGSIVGLHYSPDHGLMGFRDVYSLGSVTSNSRAGAVIGHKGPVYEASQGYVSKYGGEIIYGNPVLVCSKYNTASTANGGLCRSEEQLQEAGTYTVAWPTFDELTEFNAPYSPWLLNHDIDVFPVFKWTHRPRTTMLSVVHSREQGLVLGYVQASKGESREYIKKAYLRKRGVGSWLDAIEITTIENPDPRLGAFATDDGRVGMVANKEGKLILVASGPGTLEITETKDLNLEGIYGGLTQLGREGTRLFYYIPEVNSLVRANANYGGIWENVTFAPPGMVDSGLRISFLRAKRYVNRNRAFLTFRSDGRHLILFPNDVVWNEQPPSPIPGENSPKFNYKITVLDEEDSPVENVKSTVKKPYDQPSVTQYTDANGETTFQLHIWNYWVSLEKNGYASISEEPLDFMGAAEKTYRLQLQKANVVFTVYGDDVGALQGASIIFNSETRETDGSGQVTFYDVPLALHEYSVTAIDYEIKRGSVSIEDVYHTVFATIRPLRELRMGLLVQEWFGFADDVSLYKYASEYEPSGSDAELISFMD